MVMIAIIQKHTQWFQQLSVQLWGHWEWRAFVPVLVGIHREDECCQLPPWLDELRIPLRPLLSVMRLQGTQEPARHISVNQNTAVKVQSCKLHLPTVKLSLTEAMQALCRKRLSRIVIGCIKRSSFISPFKEVTCRAFLP